MTTNNIEAVRTMLELGASPNYRDSKNLSPLYHSCAAAATDPAITETLLHDHAHIGAQDLQGWQEVHQVSNISSQGLVHFEKHTFQEIIQSIVQIISMQPFISEMAVEIGFNVSGLS